MSVELPRSVALSEWRAAADRDRPQARALADLGHVLINAGAGGMSASGAKQKEANEQTPPNSGENDPKRSTACRDGVKRHRSSYRIAQTRCFW